MIDLTDQTEIIFNVRASRTGSNFKIGIHDSGGTTTEHVVNIAQVDTWQQESWDISGVSNANKDAIDEIKVTILNADAENVFYLDYIYATYPLTVNVNDGVGVADVSTLALTLFLALVFSLAGVIGNITAEIPTLEINVADTAGVVTATTVRTTLEIDVADTIGVAEDVSSQIKVYEVSVDDDIGLAEDVAAAIPTLDINVADDVGVADVSSVVIQILEVFVNDGVGVITDTTHLFNLYIIDVADTLGVTEDTTTAIALYGIDVNDGLSVTEDITVELTLGVNVNDSIGATDYSLLQTQILEIYTDDGVGLVDWRYHIIPDAEPIGTVDLFRFPRIPVSADEEMKHFLIELESALRTVLTGDNYVGGIVNADGCKIGEISDYVQVDKIGTLTFHGKSGMIHGHCYGNHIAWTQANMVQNTWYVISDADMVSSHLRGVTHDGSGKLTVGSAGEYLVCYHGTYALDAANKHMEWAIKINTDTPEAEGRDHSETKFANQEEHMSGHGSVVLSADDTVQLVVRMTDTGTPDITVEFLNISLTQIGGIG